MKNPNTYGACGEAQQEGRLSSAFETGLLKYTHSWVLGKALPFLYRKKQTFIKKDFSIGIIILGAKLLMPLPN